MSSKIKAENFQRTFLCWNESHVPKFLLCWAPSERNKIKILNSLIIIISAYSNNWTRITSNLFSFSTLLFFYSLNSFNQKNSLHLSYYKTHVIKTGSIKIQEYYTNKTKCPIALMNVYKSKVQRFLQTLSLLISF